MLIARYFSSRLIKSHIEVAALFTAGLFIMRLMSELKRIRLGYTSADACYYVLSMLPASLAHYDAIIIGIATCLWFINLRKTQEILVVEVSGLSMLRLLVKMLPACVVIIGITTLNREWIAPKMVEYAKEERARKVSGGKLYFKDNQMWLRTNQGFLQAIIGQDAYKLRHIHYYIFNQDRLTQWVIAPSAKYINGSWRADEATKYTMIDSIQKKSKHEHVKLPLPLKPRVISWSFLKPEYLSARQIAESLAKGKKYGISERISWLLLSVRVVRPVNLMLIIATGLTILDKAVSSRFLGLSTRLVAVVAVSVIEFLIYEFMCVNQNAIGLQESAAIAIIPACSMVLIMMIIQLYRSKNSYISLIYGNK